MPRLKKDTRTKRQQQKNFLAELEKCGNITAACKLAKIDRKAVYRWKPDPAFLVEYKEALSMGIDAIEDEATRRAFEGVKKPVFQQGKRVGYVQEFSDTLMIFLLKGRRPEIFKDRHELTGKDGGPIQTTNVDLKDLTTEQLAALAAFKKTLKKEDS